MTEHEVERLVVRLMGDAVQYESMLKDAEVSAKSFGMDMEALAKSASNAMIAGMSSAGAEAAAAMKAAEAASAKVLENANMVERELAEAKREGVEVTRLMETEQERYANQVAKLTDLLDKEAISQETFNRAVAEFRPQGFMDMGALSKSSSSAMIAGMSRAGAEADAAMRAMEAASAKALEDAAAAAQELADVKREGADVTRSVETTEESYSRRVAELTELLDKGGISQETFNRAVEGLWSPAKEAEEALKKTEDAMDAADVAAGVMAANMVSNVAANLKAFGRSVIQAFSEQEDADVALTSSLEANGRAVRATFEEYQEFASQLQRTTKYADETIVSLLTTAETFNITGAAAKKAVKDAVALAALPGARGSAESMVRLTAAMAQGDVQMAMMFARMVPQLRRIKDETKFLAEYQRIIAAGFQAEEAAAKTYSGAIAQVSNATNDLEEDLGKIAAQAIKPWIERWKEAVAVIKGFSPAVKELIVMVSAAVVGLVGLMLAFNQIATTIQVLGPVMSKLFLGTAGTVGLTTGAIVALAAAIALVAVAIYKLNPGVQAFNEATKKSEDINDKWIAKIREGTRALLDRARATDAASGKELLGGGMDEAQQLLQGYERGLKGAQDELENLGGVYKDFWGNVIPEEELNWLDRFLENRLITAARANVKGFKKLVAETKTSIEELAKTQIELEDVGETGLSTEQLAKLDEGAKELTASLRSQLDVFGMLPRAASIYTLELELEKAVMTDATEATLENIRARLKEAKAIDAVLTEWEEQHGAMDEVAADNLRHAESIEGVIESLEKEARQFGMTATQIVRDSAFMDFFLGKISEAQMTAAVAAANRMDTLTKQKELMDESKRVTEQFAEPWERLAKEKEKLDELLFAPGDAAISFDTYSKALADAEERAYGTADGIKTVHEAMRDVRGVAFGSAEAVSMYLAHQRALTGGPNALPPGVPAGAGRDMPVPQRAQGGAAGGGAGGNHGAADVMPRVVELLQRLVELAEEEEKEPGITLSPTGI